MLWRAASSRRVRGVRWHSSHDFRLARSRRSPLDPMSLLARLPWRAVASRRSAMGHELPVVITDPSELTATWLDEALDRRGLLRGNTVSRVREIGRHAGP